MKKKQFPQKQFNLLNCIGKITITKNASPELVAILMKSTPHTVKIEKEQVK